MKGIFGSEIKLSQSRGFELKEFQYKFIPRIVFKKKELFRYGINTDSDSIYCGGPDSINNIFINYEFTKTSIRKVINWFNTRMVPTFNHIQKKRFCFL